MSSQRSASYFVMFSLLLVGLSLGLIAYQTEWHCSMTYQGVDSWCFASLVDSCDSFPAFKLHAIVGGYEATIVCPWKERTATLGLMSTSMTLIYLVILLFTFDDYSPNSFPNFLGFAFFGLTGLIATLVLTIIDVVKIHDLGMDYIFRNHFLPGSYTSYSWKYTQAAPFVNIGAIVLSFLFTAALTIFKILKYIKNRKTETEVNPRRPQQDRGISYS